jgi:hypothetical protein
MKKVVWALGVQLTPQQLPLHKDLLRVVAVAEPETLIRERTQALPQEQAPIKA